MINESLQQIFHVLKEWKEQSNINEKEIIMKLEDIVSAGTKLSTAADSLSIKTDGLVAAAEAVVAALTNADLTPEQQAAVDKMNASAISTATAGDKVDAEVTKLDGLLPTPAPAGS